MATTDDIRAYLERQTRETLIDLLMEQVLHDADYRNRLLLRVAQSAPNGPDLGAFRKAIDRAVETGGYIEYQEAYDYASRVENIVRSIDELQQQGYALEARELVEYALEGLEEHIEEVDDSDGQLGGILEELQELHYNACTAARPDSESLAAWLFHKEIESSWTFSGAFTRYADLLGKTGQAEYRRLALEEWARVPALGPGQKDPHEYGRRSRITGIMEQLARETGSLEDLVAIKRHNLSRPHQFLEIARLYLEHGDAGEALAWGERGRDAFPESLDAQLGAFLVERYRAENRHDEALAILWKQFEERPVLRLYQLLKEYAEPIGRWPLWREKALAVLHSRLNEADPRRPIWIRKQGHSELVEIFLWEGEDETAWQEAQIGGCSDALWLQLAARREQAYPEDALAIYRRRIEPLIEPVTNGVYVEPVRRLLKVGELMRRLGREAQFRDYVQQLRTIYKRKRNFIKLLDTTPQL